MAREAELPDGTILEFPDGTADEVIDRAVRSHLQMAPVQRTPEEQRALEDKLTGTSIDPTQGVSGGRRFAAGGGKSIRDTGLGLVQSAAEGGAPGRAARNALEFFGLDLPDSPLYSWATDRINANQQADSALLDTGAGLSGNIAGVVGQFLGPGGVLAAGARVPRLQAYAPQLSALSRLFMPNSIKAATAQGAVVGNMAPVAEGDSRLTSTATGTLGGVVGGALPRVLGAGVRGLSRILEPLTDKGVENITGRTLQRFAANPAALQNLADPILGRAQVPGGPMVGGAPTLAEATLDPGIAQLQRAAMSKSPEVGNALTLTRQAANQERLSALQRFAGDPAKRQAAMDAIEKAENAAYGSIRKVDGVDVAPVVGRIDAILAGPEGKRKAVRSALTEAREALFQEVDGTAVPETSVNRLLGARGAIRDLLEGRGENQAGKLAQRELIAVREALDEAIRKVAPQIDTALDARRKGMAPVNEMDAMQELLGRATADVSTPTGGIAPALRPAAFMRDGDNLEQMARAGTGFRKAGEDVFSPQAQDTIEGVRVGLARQQFADNAGKVPGSPTAQFLAGQNIMDALTGQKPGIASGLAKLGAAALDKPYAFVGVPQRLEAVMARVLTNPQEAQAILSRLPAPDRMLLEQAIGRVTAPAGAQFGSGRGK